MSKRTIRREYRQLTPEQKAEYADIARKVEAEFPPGRELPPGVFNESITLGEYFDLMELCAQLRKAREARGLSLADVQELTGIDRAALCRIESGQNLNPTVATLARYAHAVGKRIGLELLEIEPAKAKNA